MVDMTALLSPLVVALSNSLDPAPQPEDVKAGYPALFLFLGLLAVILLLGWSLIRHLRRADDNRRTGVFGDAPEAVEPEATTPGTAGRSDAEIGRAHV